MKIQLAIFLLIFICFTAKAQRKELTIRFEPSFLEHSIVTVTEKKVKFSVLRRDGSILKDEERTLKEGEVQPILSFLSNYHFKNKGSIDTVEVYETTRQGEKVKAYRVLMGNDGMTVKGRYKSGSIIKDFSFWSPKEGTENHLLLAHLFTLMNSTFKSKYIVHYLDALRIYF